MAKKRDFNYFDAFVELIEYSCRSAQLLNTVLCDYNPDTVEEEMNEMHKIEHAADMYKHDMVNRLLKEFITPIDREDIMDLAEQIDTITDSIEDVLIHAYMYNVRQMLPSALEFTNIILKCTDALKEALNEFSNFKKSTKLHSLLISVNDLESAGDALYTKTTREIFTTMQDPVQILVWTNIIDCLEMCCDACERAAEVIEGAVLNNS